jgi:hypothetical protein
VPKLGGGTDSIAKLLKTVKLSNDKVDNVIILSDMMLSDGFEDLDGEDGSTMEFIKDYI